MNKFLFRCTEKTQKESGFSIYFQNVINLRGYTGYGDGSFVLNNARKEIADSYEVGKNYNIEIKPANTESEV